NDKVDKAEYRKSALERLAKPDLQNVAEVLGHILEQRCKRVDPTCSILSQLAGGQNHLLLMWEQDCKSYLRLLGDRKSGPLKAGYDLLSRAAACSRDEFDRYLG